MMNLSAYANKRIAVAVSGGVDSAVLLHRLVGVRDFYAISLCVVHCEHGIRGQESEKDMAFVQEICKAWDIPLFIFRARCLEKAEQEKISVETAAREFRKECFNQLISENKADFIATAHHKYDQAETVLFRIARGASLAGASGMKEQDGYYLRPFLTWTKEEILAYAEKNGLDYCVDSTNQSTEYTRNALRLQVFPLLEKFVPNARENFARFALLASDDEEFLVQQSQTLLNLTQDGFLVAFSKQKPLFHRAVLYAMKQLGVEKDYTYAHLESVFALQDLERGAKLNLKKGVVATKTQNGICIALETDNALPEENAQSLPFSVDGFCGAVYGVHVVFEERESVGEWKTLRLDLNKIPDNAVFRFRQEGDYIRVFGGTTKSLKKLFNERKIPVTDRAHLPVIAVGSEVLAVCGVEIADSVKVDENAKLAFLQITQTK